MKLIIALVMVSCLAGCLNKKLGTRIEMSAEQEASLLAQCSKMRSLGSYLDLKLDFDQRIRRLLKLSDRDPGLVREQIEAELKAIENDVSRIKTLSQPEWSLSTFDSIYSWQLSEKDFGDEAIEISSVEVLDVKSFGQTIVSPPGLQLSHGINSVQVIWKVPSSLLEVCELPSSLAVIIRVRFESESGPKVMDFALLAPQTRF